MHCIVRRRRKYESKVFWDTTLCSKAQVIFSYLNLAIVCILFTFLSYSKRVTREKYTQNHLANFTQIWHKASLGELNLSLCKIIKSHVPFQRISLIISCKRFFLFICLGFFVHSRIFHSYGDVTIAGEGLQIFARHSWPLSSEGS